MLGGHSGREFKKRAAGPANVYQAVCSVLRRAVGWALEANRAPADAYHFIRSRSQPFVTAKPTEAGAVLGTATVGTAAPA